MPLPQPLRGIVTPLLTPLLDTDTVDVAGLERLIEHVIAGGVHGIFLLGTSGEGPSLSLRLQREVITRGCAQVRRRVPVLAAVTNSSIVEALALSEHAAKAGADAVVNAGPLYMPVTQEQLVSYLRRFARQSPLPVYLYNMPSHTRVFFQIDTVRRAAELPAIVGRRWAAPGSRCSSAQRK
jgi:4-hydroxy-tetrahydrodipicolinate synthase